MRLFGLDISDSVIRLAMLERQRKGFRLPIRGEIQVPEGVVVDGDFAKPEIATKLLRQLIEAANPKTKRAIVALPERHTFVKVIEFPVNTQISDELVKAEVLPHLPYDWADMTFDWRVITSRVGAKNQRVLFGAAPTSVIEQYLEVLAAAEIEAIGLGVESLAIARAMLPPGSTGAHVLLDLGRTRTSLMLVNDGAVEFSTTLRYAGKDLNKFLSDALHISPEQAQRAKELFGLDPTRGRGLLAKVLGPQLDILADKIRNIQDFYEERNPGAPPVSTILLNGSGALIRNIDVELAKRLNEPVSIQPSWIVRQLSHRPEDEHDIAFTYTTALGLAMKAFFVDL